MKYWSYYVQGVLKTSITILSCYIGAVKGLEGGAKISGAEVPSHQDKALSREQSCCSNWLIDWLTNKCVINVKAKIQQDQNFQTILISAFLFFIYPLLSSTDILYSTLVLSITLLVVLIYLRKISYSGKPLFAMCCCRSLIKVKFSTDKVRRSLGSCGCSSIDWLIVTMLKDLKTALFQTFSTWHPNTFFPYCLILT